MSKLGDKSKITTKDGSKSKNMKDGSKSKNMKDGSKSKNMSLKRTTKKKETSKAKTTNKKTEKSKEDIKKSLKLPGNQRIITETSKDKDGDTQSIGS